MLCNLMYADDLDLISEIIEGLRNKSFKWSEAFESQDLRVNLGETTVIVSSVITTDVTSKSKVDLCRVCSLRVMANLVF